MASQKAAPSPLGHPQAKLHLQSIDGKNHMIAVITICNPFSQQFSDSSYHEINNLSMQKNTTNNTSSLLRIATRTKSTDSNTYGLVFGNGSSQRFHRSTKTTPFENDLLSVAAYLDRIREYANLTSLRELTEFMKSKNITPEQEGDSEIIYANANPIDALGFYTSHSAMTSISTESNSTFVPPILDPKQHNTLVTSDTVAVQISPVSHCYAPHSDTTNKTDNHNDAHEHSHEDAIDVTTMAFCHNKQQHISDMNHASLHHSYPGGKEATYEGYFGFNRQNRVYSYTKAESTHLSIEGGAAIHIQLKPSQSGLYHHPKSLHGTGKLGISRSVFSMRSIISNNALQINVFHSLP